MHTTSLKAGSATGPCRISTHLQQIEVDPRSKTTSAAAVALSLYMDADPARSGPKPPKYFKKKSYGEQGDISWGCARQGGGAAKACWGKGAQPVHPGGGGGADKLFGWLQKKSYNEQDGVTLLGCFCVCVGGGEKQGFTYLPTYMAWVQHKHPTNRQLGASTAHVG